MRRSHAWLLLLVAPLLLQLACSGESSHVTPLPDEDPVGSPNVAGAVTSDAGSTEGTLVSLETTVGGVAASVWKELAPGRDLAKTGVRATVVDAAGRYRFLGVEPGHYILDATLDDHLAATRTVQVPATATKADTIVVDVVLTPTGSLAGTVLLENGSDHASTVVYVEGTSYVAVTDPNGDYQIDGIPVGSYTVRATHPQYLDETQPGTVASAGDIGAVAQMLLRRDSNIAPSVTTIPASSINGVEGDPVPLDGTASDPDGMVVLYEWDFEDDGVFDTSSPTDAVASPIYASAGTYLAKLRVTDDDGAIGLDVVTVNVMTAPEAVYLSTTGDDQNQGNIADPVATLARAYQAAASLGVDTIRVEEGVYQETVVLAEGFHVEGGYQTPAWSQGPGLSEFQGGAIAATATGITNTTLISQIQFTAADGAPGNSSIAMRLDGCGSLLRFEDCVFRAGDGGDGSNGTTGSSGAPGGNGANGGFVFCGGNAGSGGNGGSSGCGCSGGDGGDGGVPTGDGANGFAGGCQGAVAGFGGDGGSEADGEDGTTGGSGLNGNPGQHGFVANNSGTVTGGLWVPFQSGNGTDGFCGRGGGGGGGGGGTGGVFRDETGGNGGGGGGGGGQPGIAGAGGSGGWASFGVFARGSQSTFVDCTFIAQRGGDGGNGGNGGAGGTGGAGGAGGTGCIADTGRGGNGGNGGDGGAGGGGAGGPGGPSYGIYRSISSLNLVSPVYQTGIGGTGGNGGLRGDAATQAPNGSQGLSGSIF